MTNLEVMKPCPFDGNQPEMKHKDGSCGYSPGQYYISCGCGCSSPKFDDEKWTKGRELLVFPTRQNSLRYFGGIGETHD